MYRPGEVRKHLQNLQCRHMGVRAAQQSVELATVSLKLLGTRSRL